MPYELNTAYNEQFFLDNIIDSQPMAEYLAPQLKTMLNLNRVVDIGCATGHWLNAFIKSGVDAEGIEGSANVKPYLLCSPDKVHFLDLRFPITFKKENIDLVMSIEVAEHIEGEFAETYVRNMVSFKPRLLMMTAAPPGQGGEHHVNEQFPPYWINLLQKYGYQFNPQYVQQIGALVEAGRQLVDVPPQYQHKQLKHPGVWIPYWMPKNLLVFTSTVN